MNGHLAFWRQTTTGAHLCVIVDPVIEDPQLLLIQPAVIRNSILRLEGALSQSGTAIFPSKDMVPLPGRVHLALRRDVKDLALDGYVDGLGGVAAVVLGELFGREGVVLGRAAGVE